MLSSASTRSRGHSARGTRIGSPDTRATVSRPIAASGSVRLRNVSGASSVTPILSTGQLQPQTSVRTRISGAARAIGTGDAVEVISIDNLLKGAAEMRFALRRAPVLARVQCARLRDPCIAANASGKLAQPRVDLVDVALAPARDLAIRADAELVEHAFD